MSNRIKRPEMQAFGELDLLADILADSHRGIVYARRWYPRDWALTIDGANVCAFYAVTSGELVICTSNGARETLREGDVALVSGVHVISDQGDAEPHPFSLERVQELSVPEAEGHLCMLCWAYLVDVPNHPVFSRLPSLIVARAGQRDPSVDALIRLLDHEFTSFAPGGRTVVLRYIDAMLVCILRHWIASDAPASGHWIRGLRDPVVASALALIHNDYATPWTLETLARASGASRATLARNFSATVGTTPMRFLAERRLAVAEGLLRRTNASLDEVASQVGYGSAFSLSKAFKRAFGAAPTHYVGR
jgi:AraC-like DNA-binding protein